MNTIVIEGGPGQKIVTKDSAFVVEGDVVRFINGGPGPVLVYFPVSITAEDSTIPVNEWALADVQVTATRGEYAFYVYEDFGEGRTFGENGPPSGGRRTRSAELLHSQPRIVIVASSKESTG